MKNQSIDLISKRILAICFGISMICVSLSLLTFSINHTFAKEPIRPESIAKNAVANWKFKSTNDFVYAIRYDYQEIREAFLISPSGVQSLD